MKINSYRYFFLIILVSISTVSSAQWMKARESSDDLYKMAKRDIDLKKYQKAISECRQGLEISPKNLDIRVLLGRAYALSGKLDSARTELNGVLEKNPKYREAYIYLINMEAVACNYQQAIEYADIGLKYFPNDRDFLMKKLDIYTREGDLVEGDKQAAYLYEHFSNDALIRNVYIDYKMTVARHYYTKGYVEFALRCYESVLEQDPLNKEALDAIYSLDVKSGNYAKSLESVNRALLSNPNSFELLMKKISILEAMAKYVEAIAVADRLVKLYPNNSDVYKMNIYIRMEAGRFYMNADPLILFGTVLDKEPTNKEALNYVINISYSRGLLPEALQWVNIALRHTPSDRELLGKKLGILESMENYGSAAVISETLYKENPNAANKEHMMELKNLCARQYMADQEYDSATVILNSILAYDKNNFQATNYLITVYIQQKRWDDALKVIDDALKTSPENEQLLFKKSSVLEGYQHYAEAAAISKKLVEKHPKNKYYLNSFIEQTLAQGRQFMQYEDYYSSVVAMKQVLELQPDNMDALNYIINTEMAIKQYDSALYYVDRAIKYFPDSKDFIFKKSVIYGEAKQYRAAYAISGELYKAYPYNTRFKNAYVEQILSSGRQYMNNDKPDSALVEFNKAMEISPNDTVSLFYTINLLNDKQKFDEALVLVEKGRRYYPMHPYFLLKRAVILESKREYEEAWRAMDTLSRMGPLELRYVDYKDMLYAKRLRNELGLFFLNSTYDPITTIAENSVRKIATLQYSNRRDKRTLTARVNYVGRLSGSGFQLEGDATIIHNIYWYSYFNIGYSNSTLLFPKWKGGYSLFRSFSRGFDGELGFRTVLLDSGVVNSGVGSISKDWRDFYFSFKAFLITMTGDNLTVGPYGTYLLSSRYYVNDNRSQFFSTFVGYGSVPDDFSRVIQLSRQSLTYPTVSVGAGYQVLLHYRTTLGVNFSWYNIKYRSNPETFRNQYDLYLTLLHRF